MPYCDKCDKMFATRQSLWKHRKRKHAVKSENTIAHKNQFLTDVMNNVSQRAKDQPTTSILPISPENSVVPKPRALIDFKSEKKPESEPELDSQSTSLYSDSEPEKNDKPSDIEKLKAAFRNHYKKMLNNIEQSASLYSDSESEEDDKPSDIEELQAAFRNHYGKMLNNFENLVLILDELYRADCLTNEECNAMKMRMIMKLQEKTDIA